MPSNPKKDSQTALAEALEEFVRPIRPDALADTLEPIEPALEEVDVIGLGEQSHGIRECFQAWNYLVRHLVEEHGIRTVCCEMNMIAAARLNDYIQEGEGTAEETLSADSLIPNWQSESALEFVEWLRDFNRGRAADDRVSIYGLDHVSGRLLARAVSEYLQEVDSEYYEEVAGELRYFTEKRVDVFGNMWHHDEVDPDEYVQRWEEVAPELKTRFDERSEEFVGKRSRNEYERINRAVKMLDFTADRVALGWNQDPEDIETFFDRRAEFLADACQWAYDSVDTTRMVVLAHNIHVGRGGLPTDGEYIKNEIPSMFDRLADAEGVDTVSVGFDVRGGEFGTLDVSGENRWAHIEIPEPSERSFAGVLSDATDETALVDVNAAAERRELAKWFEDEPEVFSLSTRSEPSPVQTVEADPRGTFDAIISIRDATPFSDLHE